MSDKIHGVAGLSREGELGRRSFLLGTMTGLLMGGQSVWANRFETRIQEASSSPLDRARERARNLGLTPLREVAGEIFQGLGDVPELFLKAAVTACDELASDFLTHFRQRGFDLLTPKRSSLVMVAVSSADRFADYLGQEVSDAVGGIYDLQADRLVIFDFRRPEQTPQQRYQAEVTNTLTLFHEATHQLCYHTSLLGRESDTPLCFVEGLATYCETRRATGPASGKRLGQVNRGRLEGLAVGFRQLGRWISLTELIEQDDLFFQTESQQLAYGQSWALVYTLMRDRRRRKGLVEYLNACRQTRSRPGSDRRKLAKTAFGDLDRLDRQVQSMARRLSP